MRNTGQVDWAAIRHAYCTADQTVKDICRQHGISATGLYLRRKKEEWPQRGILPEATSRSSKGIHKSKIERLYSLLDRLMKEIEMEPVGAGNNESAVKSGSADRERSARTLSSLIRSFEKIKELETEELSRIQEMDDDTLNEADQKEAAELSHLLQERFASLAKAGIT